MFLPCLMHVSLDSLHVRNHLLKLQVEALEQENQGLKELSLRQKQLLSQTKGFLKERAAAMSSNSPPSPPPTSPTSPAAALSHT